MGTSSGSAFFLSFLRGRARAESSFVDNERALRVGFSPLFLVDVVEERSENQMNNWKQKRRRSKDRQISTSKGALVVDVWSRV